MLDQNLMLVVEVELQGFVTFGGVYEAHTQGLVVSGELYPQDQRVLVGRQDLSMNDWPPSSASVQSPHQSV